MKIRIYKHTTLFLLLLAPWFVSLLQSQNKIISEEAVWEMTKDCWNLREKSPDSAIIIGLEAKAIAEEYNYSKVLPQINGFLGVIYFHYLYDIGSALPYLQESLNQSMIHNDSTRLAYSYNNLGDVFMMSGNIPLALDYSNKSIEIFQKLNNKRGIAYGYINLGLIFDQENKFDEAEKYFRKAIDLRTETGDSTGYASALYQLAKLQQHSGDLENAMANFTSSYNHHVGINNLTYTAYCLNGMATIHYLKGELEIALEKYLQAIEIHTIKGHYFGLIEDYLGIAMVYAELGESEKGKNALNKALEISSKLEMHPKVLETYKVFADFYQTLNNKEAALESLNKFVQLYDSILYLQQTEVLEEVSRTNRTEQYLKIAEQELESKAKERIYLWFIILLMIILVSVFIWIIVSLRKMNIQLRDANNSKNKLFSVISHDLRSPFNTILGFSDLLRNSIDNKDDESKMYADAVYQQSHETLRLIENLLTWSSSQSNKIKFSPKPIKIEKIYSELNANFENAALKNKISLSFINSINDDVFIDPSIIKIILNNLISNALKYTPEKGTITISASKLDASIQISVKDTGVGIDQTTIDELNKNKYIESNRGLRDERGTGLGLNICKDLLKIHKGNLIIKSTVNMGSEFIISIPQH